MLHVVVKTGTTTKAAIAAREFIEKAEAALPILREKAKISEAAAMDVKAYEAALKALAWFR